jgi:hypothetical protein
MSGKMAALVIFVLLLIFLGFALTPLVLAPLGVFTGTAHGMRNVIVDGFHFRPWFPFFPVWTFSFFFLILWIAIIIWIYKDAERRRMNGVLWALLVFIGNLIGLLIYLIVRQDHPYCLPEEQTTAGSSGPKTATSRTCPSCQKPLEKTFTYCPHCGATVQQVCPSCGKPTDTVWKVCPHCGAPLKKE